LSPNKRRTASPRNIYFQKVLDWLRAFLQQGLTPDALALGVALGMVVGVFPIFGLTTVLAIAFAILLRVNMPLVQTVNYLMTPIHLLMIIPWIRGGDWLFRHRVENWTLAGITALVEKDPWLALGELGNTTLRAIGAWAVVAPFAVGILFLILRPLFHRLANIPVK
jgi:uncharacterized protein (DUF2062 family)